MLQIGHEHQLVTKSTGWSRSGKPSRLASVGLLSLDRLQVIGELRIRMVLVGEDIQKSAQSHSISIIGGKGSSAAL